MKKDERDKKVRNEEFWALRTEMNRRKALHDRQIKILEDRQETLLGLQRVENAFLRAELQKLYRMIKLGSETI